jgi:hypothetical protein
MRYRLSKSGAMVACLLSWGVCATSLLLLSAGLAPAIGSEYGSPKSRWLILQSAVLTCAQAPLALELHRTSTLRCSFRASEERQRRPHGSGEDGIGAAADSIDATPDIHQSEEVPARHAIKQGCRPGSRSSSRKWVLHSGHRIRK